MQALVDTTSTKPISALLPRGDGHQFVVYADSCSGVAGALHETTFASVNAVIQRLQPPPQFICFPGDEIQGLVADDTVLREQWRYWFDQEMAWHDFEAIPVYHTTANHTTYDEASEAVYREVMAHLPQNGPEGQEGLAYFVRHDDLLMVFVNTLWTGLGGEGMVETVWLDQTLSANADARYKFVFGHHPVFPVNGFSGDYQREIEHANGRRFWDVLVKHGVMAYFCSHILAFDVQVHDGVLQILTAGAGTAHRMPEGAEYLHCVQAAVDHEGLRYQVLDTEGVRREWLSWPLVLPPSVEWQRLSAHSPLPQIEANTGEVIVFDFSGELLGAENISLFQTLLTLLSDNSIALPQVWVGIAGQDARAMIKLSPVVGRSPHTWIGPSLDLNAPFHFQIALHTGMRAGGVLWRLADDCPWTSLEGTSYWGAERLMWGQRWTVGHGQRGADDAPLTSHELTVKWYTQTLTL